MKKNLIALLCLALQSLPLAAEMNSPPNMDLLTVKFINENATPEQQQKIQKFCNGNVNDACIARIKDKANQLQAKHQQAKQHGSGGIEAAEASWWWCWGGLIACTVVAIDNAGN